MRPLTQLCLSSWEGLGPLIDKATASAQMLVNEAIDKAVNTAVFKNLAGELGQLINEDATSTQMPGDKVIDKAAASA
jgi:hypothetical protein